MLFNAAGLYTTGLSFDKGARAIWLNLAVTIVGLSIGFGVFYGVWTSAYATAPNTLNCWFLFSLYQYVCGIAMAAVVLPATRIYAPLERTTGFSFGYNCGYGELSCPVTQIATNVCACMHADAVDAQSLAPTMLQLPPNFLSSSATTTTNSSIALHYAPRTAAGVIGGLTPFAVSSIIDDLSESKKAYAPAFWLLALGGISVLGCLGMRMYAPRLNKRFVGRIE